MEELGQRLEQVRDWMRVDKLTLSPDKMKLLVVGLYSSLGSGCILNLDGVTLLDRQVAAVARNAHQFQLVCYLWPYLAQRDLTTVTHALVTS